MDIRTFVETWERSGAAEHSNSQSFLHDLCKVLDVERPHPATGDPDRDRYVYEKPVLLAKEGNASVGHIDLYKQDAFILEAKQGSNIGTQRIGTARRGTPGWNIAMKDAYGQALGYAKTLDDPPPFIITTDIGYCFDLYASFDGSGDYRAFPNARTNRIYLKALLDPQTGPKYLNVLRAVFTDPHALDPSRMAVKVTREVAGHLAELARILEEDEKQPPERVARFLMRCIFTMFAEDVGLLPDGLFKQLIEQHWLPNPAAFPGGIRSLWKTMNEGGDYFVGKLLQFNGGLFKDPDAVPLRAEHLLRLQEAAACDWSEVEPAIFGTLLERALDPHERHALGAHYTPRAYVERLVRPTIEEPLRAEWDVVRAEVRQLVEAGKEEQAKKAVRAFYDKLTHTRVLDPACGTGNFLYVTLDLFKRLEAEVVALLGELEESQTIGEAVGYGVTPQQFLGIEVKPWAKEIAELVLWIGYLQWHFRTRGRVNPPEPVLRDYGNIVLQDAVLTYDREELALDEAGRAVSRWDGRSYKTSPVTGEEVPDESATVPVYRYVNPRKATWPTADFIVGNPPFMGKLKALGSLGEGYVAALRSAYAGEVPDGSDLVMYWWHNAAALVAEGRVRRSGLITTNSITQAFNRRVVSEALAAAKPVSIGFAIPDHPWVDSTDGAQVRIAMTVVEPGSHPGRLLQAVKEEGSDTDTPRVELQARHGVVQPDLRIGANVAGASVLRANSMVAGTGLILGGRGFVLDDEERRTLVRADRRAAALVHPLRNGRDLTDRPRGVYVLDADGWTQDGLRSELPAVYERLYTTVREERRTNRDPRLRRDWHLFRRSNEQVRAAMRGLRRYIATSETAKHRVFVFLPADVKPEHKLVVIGSDDAFILGVLSSRIHAAWALAAGSHLGVGNDPVYAKTACFEKFPFPPGSPSPNICALAEKLDAHRKGRLEAHENLTMTGLYNVLVKVRSGAPLVAAERLVHRDGAVSVLAGLHDELDAAVAAAYGWPTDLSDEEVLARVVALNAERAEEEVRGTVRWVRPEFQNPQGVRGAATQVALIEAKGEAVEKVATQAAAWPSKLPERIAAVRGVLSEGQSLTTVEVAKRFTRPRRTDVEEVLNTLAALGLVVSFSTNGVRRWRAAARIAAA